MTILAPTPIPAAGDAPRLLDLLPPYRNYLIGEMRRAQGIKAYINALRRLFAWLGPDATLADLDQQAMLRYKAQCGTLAPSSMVKSLATVRDFAFWAASAGYAFTDPTLGIRRPRRRRPDPRPLTTEEVGQLLQAIAIPEGLTPLQHTRWNRNRLMVLVYLYTGARLTELARLTWRHIRLDAGIIEIKKRSGN